MTLRSYSDEELRPVWYKWCGITSGKRNWPKSMTFSRSLICPEGPNHNTLGQVEPKLATERLQKLSGASLRRFTIHYSLIPYDLPLKAPG